MSIFPQSTMRDHVGFVRMQSRWYVVFVESIMSTQEKMANKLTTSGRKHAEATFISEGCSLGGLATDWGQSKKCIKKPLLITHGFFVKQQ